MKRMVTSHQETPHEEVVNSLTHALGFGLSAAGLWSFLHWFGNRPIAAWSTGLFGATLTLLYLCSTAYHACPSSALKPRLQRLDHVAIFLFIAGSYTPFCLLALPNPLADYVLATVWTLATVGGLFSLCGGTRFPTLSMALMLALGWMAVFIFPYLLHSLSWSALGYLVGGGLSYTLGSVFFATHFFRFSHAVWHLFVMTGSLCHFACVWITAQSCPF
ncbi:hemolysin III family protein [bacterium]|nr:hemolysin III family protein [bacterium]